MAATLYPHQLDAVSRLRDGCILCGGVGSGKSRTSLAYFFTTEGGKILDEGQRLAHEGARIKDLYIITTAQKRDKHEWEEEMTHFLLWGIRVNSDDGGSFWGNSVKVDSWNNIAKYVDVKDAFFIFDEQRVIGKGVWVKSFLKIAKANRWILLSATPGDCWNDYIPVFIANGFYKNPTEFNKEHVVFNRFSKYPKVDRYINTGRLIRLRDKILVDMPVEKVAESKHLVIQVEYDKLAVKQFIKTRWNPYDNAPIENAAQFSYVFRRIVNSDPDRVFWVKFLAEKHKRVIIFYNYDYELDILRGIDYGEDVEVAEWNGHKHQEIPDSKKWVYLVQYTAGCEGWNCIKTDTIIFFSQNYSYRVMTQASGRIDRLNTPYKTLWYYHFKSYSQIDLAIDRAVNAKKKFNEGRFYNGFTGK